MQKSKQDAVKDLYVALRNNTVFPDALAQTYSLDEAYATQFELLNYRQTQGEKHVGWKVGLTSKAMQAQQNVHEPCLGHLVEHGHLVSPSKITFEDLMAPGFENELCIRMKSQLSGPNVSFEQAAAAIGEIAPSIEVVEKRGDFGADFPLAIAGNAQQRAFVTGPFMPFDQGVDLATLSVEVSVNGRSMEKASGVEVLGNPIHSIVWLAGKLNAFGHTLNPGDMIMSGSFTKQYAVAKGDHIIADFAALGSVEIDFSGHVD